MIGFPTILVVDDDSVQRLVIDATLTRSGYTVVTATNGREAIEALDTGLHVDLVLTDLHMPDADGVDLVRRLRETPSLRHTPVIVLTGSAGDAHDEVRVMDAGADDYLRKPVDPMRLLAHVRASLRRAGIPDVTPAEHWAD